MTNALFQGSIAIDTNVFEHLVNKQVNTDGHINTLLGNLGLLGMALLVDDQSRIVGEYTHHIVPMIKGIDEKLGEKYILNYWMNIAPRISIPIDGADRLMKAIRKEIKEPSESVDRIFVYVALSQNKMLVSNDRRHIVVGPARESLKGPRRKRILRNAKKYRGKDSRILTSREASERI